VQPAPRQSGWTYCLWSRPLSPRVACTIGSRGPIRNWRRGLAKLPRHDAILAASIKAAGVALGIAGPEAGKPSEAAPLTPSLKEDPTREQLCAAMLLRSGVPGNRLGRGEDTDYSAPIQRRALCGAADRSACRRDPGATFEPRDTCWPAANRSSSCKAVWPRRSRGKSALGRPHSSDGRLWSTYTPHDASRFVSAADVLGDKADPAQLEGKLVLRASPASA